MIVRLLLLFLLVPLSELALLIWLGRDLGVVPMVVMVLVSGVLGAALARRQGAATFRRFRDALGQGRLPASELVDGVLVLMAAAVLLAPGLLTDVAGLALMIPQVRAPVGRWLTRFLKRKLRVEIDRRTGYTAPRLDEDAVDVDFRVVEDEAEASDSDLPTGGTDSDAAAGKTPRRPGNGS